MVTNRTVCTTMHRILQRRRVRKLRFVWAFMAMVALSLAACSALFTAWTWRQTRDLSQSFKTLQERLEQVNSQRKSIVQLILEKRELVGQRVKRDGGTGKGKNGGKERKVASHFEITKESYEKVGGEGVIKGWREDEELNISRAVRYTKETGTFTVERAGVYFLFCQVLFSENQSLYVKLDVAVVKGRRQQKLQCMDGYGTTPSAGYHQFHFLKPCQVSGLLRLEKGAELQVKTGISPLSLHHSGKHYFSIFKVN